MTPKSNPRAPYVRIADGSRVERLDDVMVEKAFKLGFWDHLNRRYHLLLDESEVDTIAPELALDVAADIRLFIASPELDSDDREALGVLERLLTLAAASGCGIELAL